MNIELIIFFVTWLVSIEVIFFKSSIRDEYDNFIEAKFLSILIGTVIAIIVFGFPWFIAYLPNGPSTTIGPIAYVWYYGIMLSVAAFFLINYTIHKWLENKGR